MTTRGNWILMLATLAAAAWGFTGCAHGPAPAVETETVGNLSASYNSIAVAPVHHDAPPQLGFVAGSDDDDVSSVAIGSSRVKAAKSGVGNTPTPDSSPPGRFSHTCRHDSGKENSGRPARLSGSSGARVAVGGRP